MTALHSLEISNPAFTPPGFLALTARTDSLGGRGDILVYTDAPDQADLPVIMLLHGVQGSHWAWAFSGGAHQVYAALRAQGRIGPAVLAMPSDGLEGVGSGYLDRQAGRFEHWIMDDVPAALRVAIPGVTTRSKLYLCGLSMGGYGALRLGAKHAGRVAGIAAHSAITETAEFDHFMPQPPLHDLLGEPEDADILFWVDRHRATLPPIRFDCGHDDPLRDGNRAFHAALDRRGVVHQYQEAPGGHSWDYWHAQLEHSLLFLDSIEAA